MENFLFDSYDTVQITSHQDANYYGNNSLIKFSPQTFRGMVEFSQKFQYTFKYSDRSFFYQNFSLLFKVKDKKSFHFTPVNFYSPHIMISCRMVLIEKTFRLDEYNPSTRGLRKAPR